MSLVMARRNRDSGSECESHKTDDQGRFTFHVPPGEQHVYIQDGQSSGRGSRQDVVVPERGEIEPVRLTRNNSAPNAMMGVMKVAAPQKAEAGAVGRGGEAGVQAEIRADRVVVRKVVEKPKAQEVRTVTGRVRDAQGRPLSAVQVQVSVPRGAVPEPTRFDIAATDREGVFLLPRMPRRPLEISLNRSGFQYQFEPIPADRDEVEYTFRLVPQAGARTPAPPVAVDEPIPPGLRERLTFVNLGRIGNDFLDDGPGDRANDLNRLPRGVHKLGDIYYRIGERMVHVQGLMRPDLPQSVKGIPVQSRGDRLYILHAAQQVAEPGTLLGAYVIHYADGSSERIPVVYGRSLVNWWKFSRGTEEPTEARVAWAGSNDSTDMNPGLKIRLFAITWTNPHPEKTITSLDVLSAGKECDPFLVALTLERDR